LLIVGVLLVVLQKVLLEAILDSLALLIGHRLQDMGEYPVLRVWMVEQAQVRVLGVPRVLGLLDDLDEDPRAVGKEAEELVLLEDFGKRIQHIVL
tara:strand:+ start:209 stop:493 length:285 start_codon:yes stop_codon:yes gene_type:complete